MSNLWMVNCDTYNEGQYEDFWHNTIFIGVFDNIDKAVKVVRKHAEDCKKIYAESKFAEYEFCDYSEDKDVNEDKITIRWTENTKWKDEIEHRVYTILKITVNSYADFKPTCYI